MGRVTTYSEYDTTSATPTTAVYSKTATYNAKSQVTSDVTTVVRTDGTWVNSSWYDYFSNGVFNTSTNTYDNSAGTYQGGVLAQTYTKVSKNGNDNATCGYQKLHP